jgi:cob(I)alamin adenosyltransferase
MKIYTKSGDDGTTALFGGARVSKDAAEAEACGAVDELNAVLGWAANACALAELSSILRRLQEMMFELGADLSTPADVPADRQPVRITDAHAAELPPLNSFVLPGGCELSSRLHIARAVARRAERRVVALAGSGGPGGPVFKLLNRLSDLLFAMARRANQLHGIPDIPWKGRP